FQPPTIAPGPVLPGGSGDGRRKLSALFGSASHRTVGSASVAVGTPTRSTPTSTRRPSDFEELAPGSRIYLYPGKAFRVGKPTRAAPSRAGSPFVSITTGPAGDIAMSSPAKLT